MPIIKRKISQMHALAQAVWAVLHYLQEVSNETTFEEVGNLTNEVKPLIEPILREPKWQDPQVDEASEDSAREADNP